MTAITAGCRICAPEAKLVRFVICSVQDATLVQKQSLGGVPYTTLFRGGNDGHIKCLRALVEHGGNVNARRSTNNRTPLHYAIERELWDGYSTIVYILLAARADPNARDNAGDTPLLMLLVGMGKLPQERRNALYLLLAPNFDTKLDIRFPSTLDNPLHLAIRRKDAYVVDAILQRIQFLKGDSMSLMHDQNASGFTPILLALSIFKMTSDDAAEDFHIVKLLLDHGANPDDQTPRSRIRRSTMSSANIKTVQR
ncbi:hypothetical protein ABVK25_005441 [Lepraria finkii]|uniref:Uncharacterized protein n=1 Tax=Lepraria finkii TaxID=1340010 RepID=A0ABR4B9L3_9LECA